MTPPPDLHTPASADVSEGPRGGPRKVSRGRTYDPERPPKYWAKEAWRMRVAFRDAVARLPFTTADARLLDGVAVWLAYTGKGQPVPGPWWTLACRVAAAAVACVKDRQTADYLAPWSERAPGAAPAEAGAGFRPLGG